MTQTRKVPCSQPAGRDLIPHLKNLCPGVQCSPQRPSPTLGRWLPSAVQMVLILVPQTLDASTAHSMRIQGHRPTQVSFIIAGAEVHATISQGSPDRAQKPASSSLLLHIIARSVCVAIGSKPNQPSEAIYTIIRNERHAQVPVSPSRPPVPLPRVAFSSVLSRKLQGPEIESALFRTSNLSLQGSLVLIVPTL